MTCVVEAAGGGGMGIPYGPHCGTRLNKPGEERASYSKRWVLRRIAIGGGKCDNDVLGGEVSGGTIRAAHAGAGKGRELEE
jgi:hypothetical protein